MPTAHRCKAPITGSDAFALSHIGCLSVRNGGFASSFISFAAIAAAAVYGPMHCALRHAGSRRL